jgi:hypothetical protein
MKILPLSLLSLALAGACSDGGRPLGGDVVELASGLRNPQHIAAGHGAVYVSEGGPDPGCFDNECRHSDGKVLRMTFEAPPAVLLEAHEEVTGLTTDSAGVVVTTRGGRVLSIPAEGGTPEVLASDQKQPFNPIPAAGGIAWVNCGQCIVSLNLPFAPDAEVFHVTPGDVPRSLGLIGGSAGGMAWDGQELFLIEGASTGAVRAIDPADATQRTVVENILGSPRSVVVQDGAIYYLNDRSIERITLADGNREVLLDANAPKALAADAAHLYFTDFTSQGDIGRIAALHHDGSELETVVAENSFPGAITADDEYIYWLVPGNDRDSAGIVRAVGKPR